MKRYDLLSDDVHYVDAISNIMTDVSLCIKVQAAESQQFTHLLKLFADRHIRMKS